MHRVLWLRNGGRSQEVELFEQLLQIRVVTAERVSTSRLPLNQTRAVLIELPLASDSIQEALLAIQQAPSSIAVILYDPEAVLDESLIQPPTPAFLHLTERLSGEDLASVLRLELDRTAACSLEAPAKEPWRRLLIGDSAAMRLLHSMIRLTGPRRSTVLITGESGTGKEMVARAVHMAGGRAPAGLVAVNCGAIPENLVESELFGHVRGAFTGAVNDRAGRFEQAHRGTIFLDEIGELPLSTQVKLLRVIQEREIQRVGGSASIQVDARVIAASNQDLHQAAEERRFREDLLYRLNVVPIVVPPLRERAEDIPALAEHFLEKVCTREDLRIKTLSPDALRRLREYHWPGNVRQLEHCIEMAVTLSGERTRLYAGDMRVPAQGPTRMPAAPELVSGGELNLENTVARVERLLIQEALQQFGGNKAKAASSLGIPRTTLLYKLRHAAACA